MYCMLLLWTAKTSANSYRDYTHNLDKLAVYIDSRAGAESLDTGNKTCGFVTRLNDALLKPRLHVQCARRLRGRYVYIEAWGVTERWSRLFSAPLCEVMIYE